MEKSEQHIQSEYARNASILPDWNDICNADMTKLYEMLGRLTLIIKHGLKGMPEKDTKREM